MRSVIIAFRARPSGIRTSFLEIHQPQPCLQHLLDVLRRRAVPVFNPDTAPFGPIAMFGRVIVNGHSAMALLASQNAAPFILCGGGPTVEITNQQMPTGAQNAHTFV